MDVGKHTTAGNGGADQRVKLFVTADGQLEVTGLDTLDLEVLGSVAYEFGFTVSSQFLWLSIQRLEMAHLQARAPRR